MVTFDLNRNHSMCDGYDVLYEGQVVGFIDVAGSFRKYFDGSFTLEDQNSIREMCKRVYQMPSEWGVLGVGESPTEPFEEFIAKHPGWIQL